VPLARFSLFYRSVVLAALHYKNSHYPRDKIIRTLSKAESVISDLEHNRTLMRIFTVCRHVNDF